MSRSRPHGGSAGSSFLSSSLVLSITNANTCYAGHRRAALTFELRLSFQDEVKEAAFRVTRMRCWRISSSVSALPVGMRPLPVLSSAPFQQIWKPKQWFFEHLMDSNCPAGFVARDAVLASLLGTRWLQSSASFQINLCVRVLWTGLQLNATNTIFPQSVS